MLATFRGSFLENFLEIVSRTFLDGMKICLRNLICVCLNGVRKFDLSLLEAFDSFSTNFITFASGDVDETRYNSITMKMYIEICHTRGKSL